MLCFVAQNGHFSVPLGHGYNPQMCQQNQKSAKVAIFSKLLKSRQHHIVQEVVQNIWCDFDGRFLSVQSE